MKRCPGSMSFSQPKIELVRCPDCSADVEIWSDEATGPCPKCGRAVIRTVTQSCVDWCKYAVECLGDEKFKKYGEMKAAMRKSALVNVIQAHVNDTRRMALVQQVVAYAELLLQAHREADPHVVMAASALRVGVAADTSPTAGPLSSTVVTPEGLALAQTILGELGYPQGLVNEVGELLGTDPAPQRRESLHFKLLHDALLLVESEKQRQRVSLPAALLEAFLTEGGRTIAGQRQ